MWPRGKIAQLHPASAMLESYSTNGCPVQCGPNWSIQQILAALQRGLHISAKDLIATECLHNETNDKVKGGFAKIVKWGDIKHNIPPALKLSPIAMIPHKSRLFRCILDLSFQIKIKGQKLNSVNNGTQPMAPQKSMPQLGHVLRRIISTMKQHYNIKITFYFSKCDLKDGFCRMTVNSKDAWNFCYVLPPLNKHHTNIDNTRIVVPHALQMGWAESPPFFCSATETARDIIQFYMSITKTLPTHPLEHHLYQTTHYTKSLSTSANKINTTEMYVDDFIAITNNNTQDNIKHMSRAILHGIHSIFPSPQITNHNGGDPVSEKKLKQLE